MIYFGVCYLMALAGWLLFDQCFIYKTKEQVHEMRRQSSSIRLKKISSFVSDQDIKKAVKQILEEERYDEGAETERRTSEIQTHI